MATTRVELPITIALAAVMAITCSSLIAAGEVLLWWTSSSLSGVMIVGALISVAFLTVGWFSGIRMRRGPIPGELAVWALMLVVVGVLARPTFGWPDGSPHALSADAAHHGGIATWIAEHQTLPRGWVPQLGRLVEYPNGSHLLVAVLSHLTGIAPWRMLGIVATLLVLLIVPVVGVTASVMVEQLSMKLDQSADSARRAAALSVVACWLVAHRFTTGAITIDFFFAQVVGFVLVLIALAAIVCAHTNTPQVESRVKAIGFVGLGLVAAGSSLAYPLQVGLLPGALLVLAYIRRRSASVWKPWLVAAAVAVTAGFGSIAIVLPRVRGSQSMSGEEGQITQPSLAHLGGWIVVSLVVMALARLTKPLFSRTEREGGHRATLPAVGASLMAGQALVLWLAHRNGIGNVSRYTALKSVYVAVPLMLPVVGWVIGQTAIDLFGASRRTTSGRSANKYVSALMVGALIGVPTIRLARSRSTLSNVNGPIVATASYDLARDAARRFGAADIGVIGDEVTPYALLWIGTQGLPLDRNRALFRNGPWMRWPQITNQRHLIVVGHDLAALFAARPGVKVLERRGNTVLLERSP
jgi:hypothetical protein